MIFLKILRVASDIYPYVVGGIGIHVNELSKWQTFLGHDVTVYINDDRNTPTDEVGIYKVIKFKPIIKIVGNSISPNMFYQLIKNKNNYDIIHAHSHLFFSTNLCSLIRKFGTSPLVVTDHGLKSQTVPEWFQNIYTYTGTKFTLNSADKVICYTEKEKEELINIGIKSQKINVIHNGINTRLFIPNINKISDNNRLLWIGRFVKGKGVDYLLDAFKLLKAEYPNLVLTMVGKGPDKERIEKRIQTLAIRDSIKIIDFISNSNIVQLYQNSDVFVLPSLEEGVPRTILEAMSCGIPVVCSRLPHLVDIIKDCGLLVPIKDSQALADGISTILSDKELAIRLGENGRRNVTKNYSWEDTVKRTITLYEELIQCRK